MAKSSKIDLGIKPAEKMPMEATAMASPAKTSYPSLHVGNVEGCDKLPSGEFDFTGRGKVVHKSVSERNGKKEYSCEIEVMHIEPTGDAEEGSLDQELEKIAAKKTGKSVKQQEADEGE